MRALAAALAAAAAAALASRAAAGTPDLIALEAADLGDNLALREAADPDGKGFLDVNLFVARSRGDAEAVKAQLAARGVLGDLTSVAYFEDPATFAAAFGPGPGPALVQRGVEFAYANETFEVRGDEDASLSTWVQNSLRAPVGWVNFLDVPLEMSWRAADGRLRSVGTLQPGERHTEWRSSFVGHEFVLEHPNGTTFEYKLTTEEFFRIGQFPSRIGTRGDPSKAQLDILEKSEQGRLNRIKVNFTAQGFERIPTPRKLLGDIRRFFNVNRERGFIEDMGGGIHINTWKADSVVVPPSFETKRKWHRWFQPVLEEWAGTKLEPTDLYGIRTYHRGAVLLPHIDRHVTHAVSAIINVEQGGVDEDWDLEIYNIQGEAVYSDLQTGQAMLYESARCVHGRPKPFEGDYYTNVFFHYRPNGDPKWFANVVPGSKGKYAGMGADMEDMGDPYDEEDDNGDEESDADEARDRDEL